MVLITEEAKTESRKLLLVDLTQIKKFADLFRHSMPLPIFYIKKKIKTTKDIRNENQILTYTCHILFSGHLLNSLKKTQIA